MKEPIFNLTPEEKEIEDAIDLDDDENLDYLYDKVMAAKAEADAGNTYTHDEVVAMLGL